jgi:hypothetical protein
MAFALAALGGVMGADCFLWRGPVRCWRARACCAGVLRFSALGLRVGFGAIISQTVAVLTCLPEAPMLVCGGPWKTIWNRAMRRSCSRRAAGQSPRRAASYRRT